MVSLLQESHEPVKAERLTEVQAEKVNDCNLLRMIHAHATDHMTAESRLLR